MARLVTKDSPNYPLTDKLLTVLEGERLRRGYTQEQVEDGLDMACDEQTCHKMIAGFVEYEHGSVDLEVGNGSIQLGDYAAVVEDLILAVLNS